MPLIVQKFGGTSVATPEKIQAAARKAIRAQQEGNQVVVVVSAMGHETDHLIDLAKQVNGEPPAREMDMLLSTGEQVSVVHRSLCEPRGAKAAHARLAVLLKSLVLQERQEHLQPKAQQSFQKSWKA